MKFKNIAGKRFGKLLVAKRVDDYISLTGNKCVKWECVCDCGATVDVLAMNLLSGKTKSCGCLQTAKRESGNPKHNGSHTRLYATWSNMKQRCSNPKNPSYKDYGMRGITLCPGWSLFGPFYEWAKATGYSDGLTIERADNDKGYCPENCKWITKAAQARNKRNNHFVTIGGDTKTITEWSRITNTPLTTFRRKIKEEQHD